jgi:hypothetical protein
MPRVRLTWSAKQQLRILRRRLVRRARKKKAAT